MSGYIYKIYCEDMNYYGLTRRNKCCASSKIFKKYGACLV